MSRILLPTTEPKNILLVKLSSLGDIAHALPLAESLRSGFPDACITWAVKAKFADMLTGCPHVDRILPLESSALPALWNAGKVLREMNFDLALDAQGLLVSGLLTRLSDAPTRIGFDLNREQNARFLTHAVVPAKKRRHMVEKLMAFCDVLGIPKMPVRPQTYLACGEAQIAESLLESRCGKPVVGCIVGASRLDKAYPLGNWIEVTRLLSMEGIVPLLLGGNAEIEVAHRIHAENPAVLNLAGRTPLRILAAVLARCGAVIGGDSGPLHVAVAVGTPTVGLYGVTDPVRTGSDWGAATSLILDDAEADSPASLRRARHTTLTDALSRIAAKSVAEAAFAQLTLRREARTA